MCELYTYTCTVYLREVIEKSHNTTKKYTIVQSILAFVGIFRQIMEY